MAKNFQSSMDYLAAVGAVAEKAGHHPDLHLTDYRSVEVRLFTHDRGGITVNDLIVAAVRAANQTSTSRSLPPRSSAAPAFGNSRFHLMR